MILKDHSHFPFLQNLSGYINQKLCARIAPAIVDHVKCCCLTYDTRAASYLSEVRADVLCWKKRLGYQRHIFSIGCSASCLIGQSTVSDRSFVIPEWVLSSCRQQLHQDILQMTGVLQLCITSSWALQEPPFTTKLSRQARSRGASTCWPLYSNRARS